MHGFRPEVCVIAESLRAVIVDDLLLQRDIINLLKERDEQSGVDRASGSNGIVVRAVLSFCHDLICSKRTCVISRLQWTGSMTKR